MLENSRPPCRQQVRPRKDLLSYGTNQTGRQLSTYKIEEQRKFVAWRNANVTRPGPRKLSRGPGLILADAEDLANVSETEFIDAG
jgi:hypothetical protein